MSDEANIAGVIIAVIAVSALAGPQLSHSSASSRSTTSSSSTSVASSASDDDGGAQATRGCVAGHAVGAPAAVRLDGSTVATVTQYYGTCGGSSRNWTTVLFTGQATQRYSTQARAAIVTAGGRAMGEQSAESTDGVTSSPVATTGVCTRSTATVRLVRLSDGRAFGPLTASTAQHC